MYIYIITNNITNKQYVGLTTKTIQERFQGHKYSALLNGGFLFTQSHEEIWCR
jgi:hypothetical protein